MTHKRLMNYLNMKIELEELHLQLKEVRETILGASKLTRVPSGNNISNPTENIAIKVVKIEKKILTKISELISTVNEIEDFISSVDDIEIRVLLRKKYIKGQTWTEIGNEVHADRTTIYKKIKKFLKENEKHEKYEKHEKHENKKR